MSALQRMPQPGSRRQCWCNAQCRLPGLRSQARFPFTPARAQPHCCRTIGANAALRNLQCAQQPATSSIPATSGSRLAIPSVSTLLTVLATPLPSIADEAAKADDAALEAAQQYSTVTFGGSFGQWDPVIAIFFYLVVGSLTVLTLGVSLKSESCAAVLRGRTCSRRLAVQVLYLSIRNWQDSTDEKKDRARFSKSSQDRYHVQDS